MQGGWAPVGPHGVGARCPPGDTCIRYGTRGYVLNHAAALLLLRHASAATVQVATAFSEATQKLLKRASRSLCISSFLQPIYVAPTSGSGLMRF